jgi:hypothetical protein
MKSAAMVRVYCADGPCQGEQYMSLENGTILFDDNPGLPHYIYRTDDNERIGIRNLPIAYFDHTE